MTENKDPVQKKKYRGSLVFPILLIAVGVVLLLNTLGLLPGNFWDGVWRLWPVLLIAIGLDGILRKRGLVGGTFLIGLGIIFLLNNYDLLDFNVWAVLLTLWPIFLIAIGIDILISRKRSIWANLLGMVLVLTVLFGSLWLTGYLAVDGTASAGDQISQPLNGASRASVVIDPGVGNLRLDEHKDEGILIQGTAPISADGFSVVQSYSVSGDEGSYEIKATGVMAFFPSAESEKWIWDLSLNAVIPTSLDVTLGVGSADLTLRELSLYDFSVDAGVGKIDLELPETGNLDGFVDLGIGQVIIIIPNGMGVKIVTDTGLTFVQAPDDFTKEDGVYTSPDYFSGDNRIDLRVDLAIGNLVIRQE